MFLIRISHFSIYVRLSGSSGPRFDECRRMRRRLECRTCPDPRRVVNVACSSGQVFRVKPDQPILSSPMTRWAEGLVTGMVQKLNFPLNCSALLVFAPVIIPTCGLPIEAFGLLKLGVFTTSDASTRAWKSANSPSFLIAQCLERLRSNCLQE